MSGTWRDDEPRPPAALLEAQALLAATFRRRRALTRALDDEARAALTRVVAGNARLSPLQQAEIYREQFWLRHVDALEEDFPGLSHLLGEERFARLARAYLEALPPRSWTLRDLGDRLPAFCRGYEGFDEAQAGPARALASLDWAFVDVFDAAAEEHPPLTLADVQGLPPAAWPAARFTFDRTLTVLTLDHDVVAYRIAVRRGETPKGPIEARETHVALWRAADLKVRYRAVGLGENATLRALQGGATLGEALEAVLGQLPPEEVASLGDDLRRWFEGWAKRRWVVGLDTPPT